MSLLPARPEFAAGFLFRVISEQSTTREKLLQIFSGMFIPSFGGNAVKLEQVFSDALTFLFTNGLATHDDVVSPVIQVNRSLKP